MKVGRRKFLGLIGMSPIAAKAAADELVLKEVMSAGSYDLPISGVYQTAASGSGGVMEEPYWMKPLRWLQKNKLPEWTLSEIRQETRHVSSLDPDLAAKRSWSPAVKIAEQRERNFRRRVESTMRGPEMQAIREEFRKQTGIYI